MPGVIAVSRLCALVFVLTLACVALGCGASNRHLQSISITQITSGQQIQFSATGKFSSSPTSVTPIPVEWSVQLMAPPPKQYTLSTQPYVFTCVTSGRVPIVAYAPPDSSAPLNGAWSNAMIQASVMVNCP